MNCFTAAQSAEIDRRLVEMMTAVMGDGEYAQVCQTIADQRAIAYLSLRPVRLIDREAIDALVPSRTPARTMWQAGFARLRSGLLRLVAGEHDA